MNTKKINNLIDREINAVSDDKTKQALKNMKISQSWINKIFRKDILDTEYETLYNDVSKIIYQYAKDTYGFKAIFLKKDELWSGMMYELMRYINLSNSFEVISNHSIRMNCSHVSVLGMEAYYNDELKSLVAKHMKDGDNIEVLIQQDTENKRQQNAKLLNNIKNYEFQPYFGDLEYMMQRANYIYRMISLLNINDESVVQLIEEMNLIYNKYPKKRNDYEYFDTSFKESYHLMENAYIKILEIEKKYLNINLKNWKKYLTDPQNHDDNHFAYLAHTFSNGLVAQDDFNKVCCSLATDDLLTLPYGKYGVLCDIDENVDTMCTADVGSWVIDKNSFFERNMPSSWQLTNPNGTSVFYEFPENSSLIPPEYMHEEAFLKNINHNGSPLNYEKFMSYTEIFISGKPKVIGAFYTDSCDIKDMEIIKDYAQKYNLPLINLSLKKQLKIYQDMNKDFNETEVKGLGKHL